MWLAWPWASQAITRERFWAPAVLATCVPWACEWAAACARGRRAIAHRRLVTFARFGERTWHLQPCCKWSGNQTRAVGGRDHRTPPSGASTPLWGGVSQGASARRNMCLPAWDFPSQGGESPTLGEVPWHIHRNICRKRRSLWILSGCLSSRHV